MAALFLFCSTKESRLCQTQISIRSNLNPLKSQSVRHWLPTPTYPDGTPPTSRERCPRIAMSNPGYAG
jgi:hypothetical protein